MNMSELNECMTSVFMSSVYIKGVHDMKMSVYDEHDECIT